MSDSRITLEAAAFLDSPFARGIQGARGNDVREIVRTCLSCVYEGLGKAPKHLDGDDVHELLCELLPARFGRKDPRVPLVVPAVRAWFEFLAERDVLVHAYEMRMQVDADAGEFEKAVGRGAGVVARKGKPFVHRGEKVGRNDPCPCGSGKKFKACCGCR